MAKNNEGTLVSALADQTICATNNENINEDIKLKYFCFVIIKVKKNMLKIVNVPKIVEVYNAAQLLTPKIPNIIDNRKGHPIDLE